MLAALAFLCAALCCTAQKAQPVVQNIRAVPTAQGSISITWTIPPAAEGTAICSLQIYRSTMPISSAAELAQLSPLALLPSGSISYTDSPTDGRDYYYAVVSRIKDVDASYKDAGVFSGEDAQELYYDEDFDPPLAAEEGRLLAVILPGMNATLAGARATPASPSGDRPDADDSSQSTKKSARGDMRRQPLPYLEMPGSRADDGGRQISEAAEQAAKGLVSSRTEAASPAAQQLAPHIFAEDSVSPSGGDEYLLYEVLQRSFVQGKYSSATALLERFLAQNRGTAVTQRAHFYLGQAYYFCGDYPRALQQFLKVENAYPPLAARWIDSSLDLYEPERRH